MRKKIIISAFVFSLAMLLALYIRFVLVADYKRTADQRLKLYAENLSAQQNRIVRSFEKIAAFCYLTLKSDSVLQIISSGTCGSLVQNIGEVGLTLIPVDYLQQNKQGSAVELISNKETAEKDSMFGQQGFCFTPGFAGYIFKYRLSFGGLSGKELFMGFDYRQFLEGTCHEQDTRTGILVLSDSNEKLGKLASQDGFQKSSFMPGCWVNNDFSMPENLLRNPNAMKELKQGLVNALKGNSGGAFSVFFANNRGDNVLAVSKIVGNGTDGAVFFITSGYDQFMANNERWKLRLYALNLVIILFVLSLLVYLYASRIAIMREKAKLVRSSQKLHEMNVAKDKFFSIIAHDLKNPFNGIMGISTYLNDEFDNVDEEEKRELIADINVASKNAFNLLQNLLEWTRTQTGMIKYIPAKIDIEGIIELALETVYFLAKNKEIVFKIKIDTKRFAYADENLVATVIRNLSTNAVKFSPRGSTIYMEVKEWKNMIVFSIKDQGIGLSHEEIDKLFRIDVNFNKKGTEQEAGSGLGLKLCKEFVDRCGGRIWVVSEAGQGSTFFFTLPMYADGRIFEQID